jgi:hypothetical protein
VAGAQAGTKREDGDYARAPSAQVAARVP